MVVKPSHRRRGSIYVAILGTSMIITVIGLSALMASRIEHRFTAGTTDFAQARFYAQSAVEMGLFRTFTNPNWRTTYTSGAWWTNQPIGTGTYTLEGIDPQDGILSNSATDPVVLTGMGQQGQTLCKLEATLVAHVPPLTSLEVAIQAGNSVTMTNAIVQSDYIINANNSITTSKSIIDADVAAVNVVAGGGYTGPVTAAPSSRTMPNASVFNYYLAQGTPIDINLLAHNSHFDLQDVVLSPQSNPYGVPNPEGIYIINCMGGELRIKNCRIVGTLVIQSPALTSRIGQSVNFASAVFNYPVLLVNGDMSLQFTNTPLSEATRKMNFNPPGTPYQSVEDIDQMDSYPSLINGLVYVSGNVNTSNTITMAGVLIVGNTLNVTGSLSVNYRSTYLANPPPGFTDTPRMLIQPGSWKQVVNIN